MLKQTETTRRVIERGIIACLIIVGIVGVLATLGPQLNRVYDVVRASL